MAAEKIDAETAWQMWRAGDTVIDVRTAEEYASGHISGALHVPIDSLPNGLDGIDGPIVTTCAMGGRAARAAELLAAAGRTAFAIDGGTKAWDAAGHPVVSGTAPGPR